MDRLTGKLKLYFVALGAASLLFVGSPGELQAEPTKSQITAKNGSSGGGSSKKARKKKKRKKKKKKSSTIRYQVRSGDTLVEIAKAHGVRVEDIVRWNKLKDPNKLKIGQKLKIVSSTGGSSSSSSKSSGRAERKVTYIVRKGDTLGAIAKKNDVEMKKLLKWNRKLKKNPDSLRIGQKITLWKQGPANGSSSVGLANRGKLYNSEQLPKGKGYYRRNPGRQWGTNLSVTHVMEVFAKYHSKYPKAADAVIGDMSFRKGGKMKPHKSHQSGRDIDIGYIDKSGKQLKKFKKMNKDNFDVAKNWYIIKKFLDTGDIEYIFIDYKLQKLLYDYAKKKGVKTSYLDKVFQYPAGKSSSSGIIRHTRGHRDHMHVRFGCPKGDKKCR